MKTHIVTLDMYHEKLYAHTPMDPEKPQVSNGAYIQYYTMLTNIPRDMQYNDVVIAMFISSSIYLYSVGRFRSYFDTGNGYSIIVTDNFDIREIIR